MSILAIKSVPLWKETNRAWKSVPGLWFVDRKRDPGSIVRHIASRNYEAILNLGRVDINFRGLIPPVFNSPDTVRAVSTPRAIARTLDGLDLLPEDTHVGPHWHKERGFGGFGKEFVGTWGTRCDAFRGVSQVHVAGDEYRILTVGDRVVQASKKIERRTTIGGRNDFTYSWVGVEGVRQRGFIPAVKEAVAAVPDFEQTVFGWDVIHDGERPYIIECNTSPGVNEATAGRIVEAVRNAIR